MRSPLRNLSRRSLLALNLLFLALSAVLIVVTISVVTGEDEPTGARSVQQPPPEAVADPEPLRNRVRTRSPVGNVERARCRERRHTTPNPDRWFHPRESFYPPDGTAPAQADLDHLVNNDDAVAVTYRRDASAAARRALERWASVGIGVVVAPSQTRDAAPLEAITRTRRLTCDGVDLDRLTEFTDRHFNEPLRYRKHGSASRETD